MLKSQFGSRHKIVFFDGVCHLCNGFVDFAIQNETKPRTLSYAPLQGETAQTLLTKEDQTALSSVVFLDDGRVNRKSSAVILILRHLKFPWPLLANLMRLCPVGIRDVIYDWVAKNRYAWFGQRESCRLPTADEKSQLLP